MILILVVLTAALTAIPTDGLLAVAVACIAFYPVAVAMACILARPVAGCCSICWPVLAFMALPLMKSE